MDTKGLSADLWEASVRGDFGELIRLITLGADVNYKPEYVGSRSALANILLSTELTESQRAELCERFLNLGASLADNEGLPILGYACVHPNARAISVLIRHKADIHATVNGVPLLHVCTRNNNAENLKVLLEAGANVDAMAPDGSTALRVALARLAAEDGAEGDDDEEKASDSDKTTRSLNEKDDHDDNDHLEKDSKGATQLAFESESSLAKLLPKLAWGKSSSSDADKHMKTVTAESKIKTRDCELLNIDDDDEADNPERRYVPPPDELQTNEWSPSDPRAFTQHVALLSDEEVLRWDAEEGKQDLTNPFACIKVLVDHGATWICPLCVHLGNKEHEHVPSAAVTVVGEGGVNVLRWLFRYASLVDRWRCEFTSKLKKGAVTLPPEAPSSKVSERASAIRQRLARVLSQVPPPRALLHDFDRASGRSLWHIAASHKKYWVMHWLLEQARSELERELMRGPLGFLERVIKASPSMISQPDEVQLEIDPDNSTTLQSVKSFAPWKQLLEIAQKHLKPYFSADVNPLLFAELGLCDEEESVTPLLATSHATVQGGEVFNLLTLPCIELEHVPSLHSGSRLVAKTDVRACVEETLWKWASRFWLTIPTEFRQEDMAKANELAQFLTKHIMGMPFMDACDLVEAIDETGLNIVQRAVYYGADELLQCVLKFAAETRRRKPASASNPQHADKGSKSRRVGNEDDEDDKVPCECAVINGSCILKNLVLHVSPKRRNALHVAKLMGSRRCGDLLLRAITDHDQRLNDSGYLIKPTLKEMVFSQLDVNGFAPHELEQLNEAMMRAIELGDSLTLAQALRRGAHPHYADGQGRYPVPLAATLGNDLILGQLLNMGGDEFVNDRDEDGHTAVWLAACMGHARCVGELMRHGADVLALDQVTGQSAFLAACAKGHTEVVQVILQEQSRLGGKAALREALEHTDNAGRTPLLTAAALLRPDIIKELLKAGANPNAVDDDGRDALEHVKVMLLEMEQWSENKARARKARARRRMQRALYLRGIRGAQLLGDGTDDAQDLASLAEEEEVEWSKGRYREGALERRRRELAAFFEEGLDYESPSSLHSNEDLKVKRPSPTPQPDDGSMALTTEEKRQALNYVPPLAADVANAQEEVDAEMAERSVLAKAADWIVGKAEKLGEFLDRAQELSAQAFRNIDDDPDGGLAYFEETKRLVSVSGDPESLKHVKSLEDEARDDQLDKARHQEKLDSYLLRAKRSIEILMQACDLDRAARIKT